MPNKRVEQKSAKPNHIPSLRTEEGRDKPWCFSLYSLFLVLSLSLLASCSSSVRFTSERKPFYYPSNRPATVGTRRRAYDNSATSLSSPVQKSVVRTAEAWLGTPYCYGGSSPQCVDCSGFVINVFRAVNVQLPRTSREMYAQGKAIQLDDISIGDLVFFDFERDGSVGHVGMYIGNGEVIHASTSRGVIIQPLEDDYLRRFVVGYRRWL